MNKCCYYLLGDGEIAERGNAYRRAYRARHEELMAIAKYLGGVGYAQSRLSMNLAGVMFEGTPPAGWTKPNRHGVSRPRKDRPDLLQHFDGDGAVERFKPLTEFIDWLGVPTDYNYTTPGGGWGGSSIGVPFTPVGFAWYEANGPLLLQIPDVAWYDTQSREKNEVVEGDALRWRMHPAHPGARQILLEEWQVMVARFKHDRERAA